MERERVLSLLKKLFARAADPTAPEEAALAATRAQEILLKYKLNQADLEDEEAKTLFNTIVEEDLNFPKGLREVPNWKRYLGGVIARNHFCHLFATPRGLRFVGAEEDIAFVAWMFGYLDTTLERLSNTAWKWEKQKREIRRSQVFLTDVPEPKRDGVTWKNHFRFGAIKIIEERLIAQRLQKEQEAILNRREQLRREMDEAWKSGRSNYSKALSRLSESWESSERTALAPWREAEKRVNDYIKEHYSHAQEVRKQTKDVNPDAFLQGMIAGAKIGLNKPLSSGEISNSKVLKS